MVESGYSRTWCDSVIWWSPGIIFTIVPTSQSQEGGVVKMEGKLYKSTTTPEYSEDRTAVPISIVKTESERCVYTRVSTLHTHTFDCKAEWQKPTNTEYTPITWENLGIFFFITMQTLA